MHSEQSESEPLSSFKTLWQIEQALKMEQATTFDSWALRASAAALLAAILLTVAGDNSVKAALAGDDSTTAALDSDGGTRHGDTIVGNTAASWAANCCKP